MNLWNVEDLALPPINTYKASNKNVDIKHLYNVCQDTKNFFNNKYMHAEFLVLSRIIYRMKQKFRSSKDFKALEKVNKALEILFRLGILNDVSTFMELIPSRYKDETYLPTKSMLDYLLVRFQGLAKLMERLIETCKISAFLLSMRMKTGHFWRIAFISFALVSRLYILAKYNANRICEFYGKLLPFSGQLRNSGKNWLPSGYILPTDLKEWMNVDWLDFDDEVQIIENPDIPDIIEFFDLVENDDDDIEFYDEYVMIDDAEIMRGFKGVQKTSTSIANMQSLKELQGFRLEEDIGEVIEVKDIERVITESKISNDECDVINLSDNSVELIGGNDELSDEDEIILVPSIPSEKNIVTKSKRPKLNTKKLNRRKNKENVKIFEMDKKSRPVLNNSKEFSIKNKSLEPNKQNISTEFLKRKKNRISKNKNVKRIKLSVETSRADDNNLECESETFYTKKSYEACDSTVQKKNYSEQQGLHFGTSTTSGVPGSSEKRKKRKKKKQKKLKHFSNI